MESGGGFLIALGAVLGMIFGSFGSVIAYRVPVRMLREGHDTSEESRPGETADSVADESILTGRSRCPNCGRVISPIENIPVVSYILQRGRCKGCGIRIPIRYPLIELATGVLFALAAWKFGLTIEAFLFAALFWVLVVLTQIDLEYRLLPNRIVYPAFVVGWMGLVVAALVDGSADRLIDGALGAVIFGGFFFVVAFIYPAGMGGGDVKLGFVLGTFLGYLDGVGVVLVGMFLAFLIGSLVGIGVMLFTKRGRKAMVPFGPFLALGTVLAVFVGRSIADWYTDLL
ncbi:MAG TPA: prepilin peptidase [Actinomycetota bacterium]|nr:prepilin peptidase [Actinomycetota bacterium]